MLHVGQGVPGPRPRALAVYNGSRHSRAPDKDATQWYRFTGIIPVCELFLIKLEWYWYVVFESGMHLFDFLPCYSL